MINTKKPTLLAASRAATSASTTSTQSITSAKSTASLSATPTRASLAASTAKTGDSFERGASIKANPFTNASTSARFGSFADRMGPKSADLSSGFAKMSRVSWDKGDSHDAGMIMAGGAAAAAKGLAGYEVALIRIGGTAAQQSLAGAAVALSLGAGYAFGSWAGEATGLNRSIADTIYDALNPSDAGTGKPPASNVVGDPAFIGPPAPPADEEGKGPASNTPGDPAFIGPPAPPADDEGQAPASNTPGDPAFIGPPAPPPEDESDGDSDSDSEGTGGAEGSQGAEGSDDAAPTGETDDSSGDSSDSSDESSDDSDDSDDADGDADNTASTSSNTDPNDDRDTGPGEGSRTRGSGLVHRMDPAGGDFDGMPGSPLPGKTPPSRRPNPGDPVRDGNDTEPSAPTRPSVGAGLADPVGPSGDLAVLPTDASLANKTLRGRGFGLGNPTEGVIHSVSRDG